jgi:hypothetical protein
MCQTPDGGKTGKSIPTRSPHKTTAPQSPLSSSPFSGYRYYLTFL